MELTSTEIKSRLEYLFMNKFEVYVLKHDGSFRIGFLTKIIDESQYEIDDNKLGKEPVCVSEIKYLRKSNGRR